MASADAVRQQLQIWERLMHMNVKMHGALRSVQQFPRGQDATRLLNESDETVRENYFQTKRNADKIVYLLADLEKTLDETTQKADADEADEEIESSASEAEDDDDLAEDEGDNEGEEDLQEEDEESPAEETNGVGKRPKVRKGKMDVNALTALERTIERNDKSYETKRAAVLEKWYERTRLTFSKKGKDNFDELESSATNQIRKILSDRGRLIRRTQLKRINVDRIGANGDSTHDAEVFDDDDFYQNLLKEFIDQKSSETVDPIQISRQWLEVQKLRQQRNKKRAVDANATKGRKVRYVAAPKVTNFSPAIPEALDWVHERRNELFTSVFRY